MKKSEKEKLAKAKARAKKAAQEKKNGTLGTRNKWGYFENTKGGQVCIFVAKSKKGCTVEDLKKQKWCTSRHTQVFNELPTRGGKLLKDGRMQLS